MKCFVIMPFGNPRINADHARKLESIYSQWIKPTVESIIIPGTNDEKLTCHRADKTAKPGEIISHIIENLIDSDIVIADLSGKNANVFYELGVRHAVNSNAVLIADNIDDIPFDLRGLRTIVYEYEPESMLALKSSLEKAINEILKEPDKIDNPVRRFLYNREVERIAEQPMPSYESETVRTLLSEMTSLRAELNQQTDEVRQIVKIITAPKSDQVLFQGEKNASLILFQGTWRNEDTESTYYARVVNDRLFVPYSYGGQCFWLTGHYYNCKAVGETLFARFEWFKSDISGYVYLNLESPDKLVGGWWYKDDLPRHVLADFSRINPRIPKMNSYVLAKVGDHSRFPDWVETYFEKLQ